MPTQTPTPDASTRPSDSPGERLERPSFAASLLTVGAGTLWLYLCCVFVYGETIAGVSLGPLPTGLAMVGGVLAEMSPASAEHLLYYRADHHWNARCNEVAAAVIERALTS